MFHAIAQLQQENDRLTSQCDRLQAELTDLQSRYEMLQQSEAQNHQAPLLSVVSQVANLLLRSQDYTTVLRDVVRLLGEVVGSDRWRSPRTRYSTQCLCWNRSLKR
jgi:predicted nuclease with TOPRIM domain